MLDIDNDTLLISIQAVYQNIKLYEFLLGFETLKDPENIEALLLSYDEALAVIKDLHNKQLGAGANFPQLESVLYAE